LHAARGAQFLAPRAGGLRVGVECALGHLDRASLEVGAEGAGLDQRTP
jgi:hypothetical protein